MLRLLRFSQIAPTKEASSFNLSWPEVWAGATTVGFSFVVTATTFF
jgi:hypothetical protein